MGQAADEGMDRQRFELGSFLRLNPKKRLSIPSADVA